MALVLLGQQGNSGVCAVVAMSVVVAVIGLKAIW